MVFFITVLRALSACLITNAHYTDVYPTNLIANGGLIGDILFFAISGYCLCNIKLPFTKWYGKRLVKIYPPVIIITLIYWIMGAYSIELESIFNWFIYPTYYHFVASIIVLYIPFYIFMRNDKIRNNLIKVMTGFSIVWLFVYFIFYDKTYYHIDNVYEPMIRCLFFQAMLLGAYFKIHENKYKDCFFYRDVFGIFIFAILYFLSKLFFSKTEMFSYWQFLNQIIIFCLLIFVFRVFAGLDSKLERLPFGLKKVISGISTLTLEIYVVQYVLIAKLRQVVSFPANWLVLTISIMICAWLLHKICQGCYWIAHTLYSTRKK